MLNVLDIAYKIARVRTYICAFLYCVCVCNFTIFTSPSSERYEPFERLLPGVHFDNVDAVDDFGHQSHPLIRLLGDARA